MLDPGLRSSELEVRMLRSKRFIKSSLKQPFGAVQKARNGVPHPNLNGEVQRNHNFSAATSSSHATPFLLCEDY
jgi:hypothetical protein